VAPLPPQWAAELFLQRALQAAPAASATDPDVVAAICQRLDCLPLAIELAAARSDLLPPPALLARLDQAMKVLTGGSRDLPARQQTLSHALTWSYDLLSRDEQALFRQLAVFAGGWTLGAAAAISGLDEATALQLHAALFDNSLIVRKEEAAEPRFGLLQTIWAYATERLEAAGQDDRVARDRHAAYYRDLALTAGTELWGPTQAGWLDRLQLEGDNLRLALQRNAGQPRGRPLRPRLIGALALLVDPGLPRRGPPLGGQGPRSRVSGQHLQPRQAAVHRRFPADRRGSQ
jgi:predicted ATPase